MFFYTEKEFNELYEYYDYKLLKMYRIDINDILFSMIGFNLSINLSKSFGFAPILEFIFNSNNAGGILGGISTGQEIIVSFAVKPTSSILKSRKTIDKFGKNTSISVKGRHDPCVGIRAVPVGEAMLNCVLLDHYLMNKAQCS